MSKTLTVEKEMAISHRDFFRILPRALGTEDYRVEGSTIRYENGGQRLEITLSAESERRIALVAIPVTRVRLAFFGYDEPQAALTRFERYFQRGGG